MKIAIMQPYFFPYIGYFQLLNAVDEFIVYDNIEFTKKGWINRNRILVNGKDVYITLPLRKDSDYLDIKERVLTNNWKSVKKKLLNRIIEAYRKSPYFSDAFSLIEKVFLFENMNLFQFLLNSINLVNDYLDIKTQIVISSSIPNQNIFKAEKKVIEICKTRKISTYLNALGGINLYDEKKFEIEGIDLLFLRSDDIKYKQFNNDFIHSLSIIDVMMFNSKEEIKKMLELYILE